MCGIANLKTQLRNQFSIFLKMKIPKYIFLVTLPFQWILLSGNSNSTRGDERILQADSFHLGNGKKVFTAQCSGCHGVAGQGSYGPNLCDKYWIHGAHYHNIVHIIKHGTSNGMTSFKHKLKHHDVRDVAHYVLSLQGSKPANAKAAEGKLH